MLPDKDGYFGIFGGKYVPENLLEPLADLEDTYRNLRTDEKFMHELNKYMHDYVNRPTPLYYAANISKKLNLEVYIKREDLIPSGSYKLNNAIGQVLLSKYLGKRRIVSFTESGQNGVAVATAAKLFEVPCKIYIHKGDISLMGNNYAKLKLMGVEVEEISVEKEKIHEIALNYWLENYDDVFLIMDSIIGPHPYPMIVRDFQAVVGKEARRQIIEQSGKTPDMVISSTKYGTNSAGLFYSFYDDAGSQMISVINRPDLTDSMLSLTAGVFFGCKAYRLLDETPATQRKMIFGPEMSYYVEQGRVSLGTVLRENIKEAYRLVVESEALFPSINSISSLAYVLKNIDEIEKRSIILLNINSLPDSDFAILKEMGVM